MTLRTTRARWTAAALATSAAFSAHAQSALQETVISATRVAQPLSDVVADVTIIDRERIERSGATGLADVLARVPGVEFSRNGGPGTTTGVFLRGAESRFTAVFVDGVRLDSQSTGGAAWESIPLGQIDRIEVLRGPAGAVYGSDAIGGVVQIFTRKGEGAFTPYVGVGAGTYSTRKLEAGFSGAQNGVDYALGLGHERSNGFNARPLPTQNPDNDGYRSRSASARLGWQINPAQRLEASLLANDLDSQYDGSLLNDDHNHHKLEAYGLHWRAQWSEAYSTRLSATESRDRYETRPSPYLTTTTLRGYTFLNELRLGAHLLTAALERKEDALQNAPIDRDRHQDALALGYGFTNKVHTVQLNLRQDRDSEFGSHSTGSLAYAYAFAPAWRVSASAGSAFRAPTLYQRFSEYGVASLRPESARNLEIALRWVQGTSNASLTAYRNKVSDLISFVGPGTCASAFGCYANTARAEYSGVTLAGEHRLGSANLRGSLDLQDPKDLGAGKQLARRAREHGTLGLDLPVAGWTLGAESQFSGQRYDNAANTTTLGGYALFHLYATTRLAPEWTLLLRVDNLSDKPYELARSFANPGRAFFASLKWSPR